MQPFNFLKIRDLLTQRISIIQQDSMHKLTPDEQLNQLKHNYESIQSHYLEHRKEFPPILRHYIEQQSYLKAIDFLNEALSGVESGKSDSP